MKFWQDMKGSGDSPIYFPELSKASEVLHQRIKLCTEQPSSLPKTALSGTGTANIWRGREGSL